MSSQYRPLSCKEVKIILQNLGFVPRPQRGTSHEQWVKDFENGRLKVTVDCLKAPFGQILISYLAKQAGVTKKEFYSALNK